MEQNDGILGASSSEIVDVDAVRFAVPTDPGRHGTVPSYRSFASVMKWFRSRYAENIGINAPRGPLGALSGCSNLSPRAGAKCRSRAEYSVVVNTHTSVGWMHTLPNGCRSAAASALEKRTSKSNDLAREAVGCNGLFSGQLATLSLCFRPCELVVIEAPAGTPQPPCHVRWRNLCPRR